MRHRASWVLAGLALTVLAACSTAIPKRVSVAERREQFLQYAGPPVDTFTYLGRYYAWRPLGKLQLVIWTTINDAYLITVLPPCVGLDFATGIRLTSTGHTVTRGIDAIEFDQQHCFISQIRPVDYLAMKKATHSGP
jgi:hypothetical protein